MHFSETSGDVQSDFFVCRIMENASLTLDPQKTYRFHKNWVIQEVARQQLFAARREIRSPFFIPYSFLAPGCVLITLCRPCSLLDFSFLANLR